METRICLYEFCAKEFVLGRYKKPGVQKFCSPRCKTLYGMRKHRTRWNRIQKKANRKARSNWSRERRDKHKRDCKRYNDENWFELKMKRMAKES